LAVVVRIRIGEGWGGRWRIVQAGQAGVFGRGGGIGDGLLVLEDWVCFAVFPHRILAQAVEAVKGRLPRPAQSALIASQDAQGGTGFDVAEEGRAEQHGHGDAGVGVAGAIVVGFDEAADVGADASMLETQSDALPPFALPSGVWGPVDLWALRRLAAIWRLVAMGASSGLRVAGGGGAVDVSS
jgi:hypothetical protein